MKLLLCGYLLLSLTVLLSGCTSGEGQSAASEPPNAYRPPVSSEAKPPAAQSTAADKENTTDEQTPERTSDLDQPLGEEEAPEATEYTYYMNDRYMIVPMEEGTPKKVALLTFDDGPKDEEVLSSILDTLKNHDALAIFFVNGYRVKQHPELLQQINEAGHAIGNHSWDHIDLKKQTQEEIKRQIGDVQTLVADLTGQPPVFFRPPFGSANDAVKAKAADEGMLFMTWSNGSRDWIKEYQTPDKVVKSVLEQLHPGSNILMHELPWTAEALDTLLTELETRGYGFVNPHHIDPAYSNN